MLSQRKQGGALGLLVGRESLPLRSPDRAEQNRFGSFAGRDGLFGERFACPVNRRAADELFVEGKRGPVAIRAGREDLEGSGP